MAELGGGEESGGGAGYSSGVGLLTQGLEDSGSFLRLADRLEVRRQGRVVTHEGRESLSLEAGVGPPLLLQVTKFLY